MGGQLKRWISVGLATLALTVVPLLNLVTVQAEDLIVFSGKMLLNGGAPGDYYRSNVDGQFKGIIVAGPAGGEFANVDPVTGDFSVSLPRGDDYEIRVNFYGGGYGAIARGLDSFSPRLSLQSDTYREFNLDTSENAAQTTVKVVDQCNNPLEGVLIYPEIASYFHLDSETTARAQYGSQQGSTNAQGEFTFPMQLDNQGGILRAEYDSSEGMIRRDLLLPNVSTQVRVFQIPSCIMSDNTSPSLSAPSWSINPKTVSQTSTFSVTGTDNVAIVGGEYFFGDTDPGQGNGTAMTWNGTSLTTNFGANTSTGVHKVTVRAVDAAGNWSEPTVDYLVVYDPDGARMTAGRTVKPSLANGDVLPGLISNNQNDRANFGFNVRYNNQGLISSGSDLQFSYRTGTWCLIPIWAQNCHSIELNATSIAWSTTESVNDSTGIFQGTARLRVDGVVSTVLFRVTGLDGGRLNPTTDDRFTLKVYSQGANLNTDQPLYQVSAEVIQGSIRIIF